MSYRVIQTVAAFRYPAGKVWGPYTCEDFAQDQLAKIRRYDGDGVIEEGEFGAPAVALRPVDVGGPSAARELEYA